MKAVINGITLGYTDRGNGTTLVFIHAFPLSKSMWLPQVDALKDSCRVITLDLRGHGESDTMLWNWTLDDYAADVIGLLDHLGIAQAVFIGLSMGGYTVFSLCRHFADRVHAIVLADTRAQADTEEGKAGRRGMAQIAFNEGASAIADLMIPKLLAPSTIQRQPDMVEQVRQMILQTPSVGIVADLMAMAARPDSTDLLTLITCPTLILVGEQDVATPVAESRYMADRIPGATLVTIPEAGHLSNIEQPRAFNHALETFLQRLKE
ncbi:MAG: alpha/beta fold hydrolase [Nitrospirales bacterium]|nr:alpha/beta fold hydrolase [Nitrospirales bacterium]